MKLLQNIVAAFIVIVIIAVVLTSFGFAIALVVWLFQVGMWFLGGLAVVVLLSILGGIWATLEDV